ncbi:MAG TPA: hypothetical protein VFN36_00880 [Solirubrobacteraceae bacterium]|nr:hypothetical protein [Solirubrobacteraceae bacterium]
MTTPLLALNAILMLSVVVAIVTLLAWAIRAQHRARTTSAVVTDRAVRPARSRTRPVSPPRRRAVTGRA